MLTYFVHVIGRRRLEHFREGTDGLMRSIASLYTESRQQSAYYTSKFQLAAVSFAKRALAHEESRQILLFLSRLS